MRNKNKKKKGKKMLTVVPFGGYNFYSDEDKKNLTAYMDSLENVDTI